MRFPLRLALIIAPIVALVVFATLIALMPRGTAKIRLDEGRVTYTRADYDAALNKFMLLAKAYNTHRRCSIYCVTEARAWRKISYLWQSCINSPHMPKYL